VIINLQEIRQEWKKELLNKGNENPENNSLVLISHSLNKPKSWVLAHGEYKLNKKEIQKIENQFMKYIKGVPLPYLLGEWEFYGRRFKVTPEVLIPRPETELLVDLAIQFGKEKESLSIIDIGTGSGIIAVSLASVFSNAKVVATDISMDALKIAKGNAQIHHVDQVKFIQSDLLTPINGEFDLICANLPYIPSQNLNNLPVAKWEPRVALDGGMSGLELIEKLLMQTRTKLARGGTALLEIESTLGEQNLNLARKILPRADLHIHQDLSGKDRVLEIQ